MLAVPERSAVPGEDCEGTYPAGFSWAPSHDAPCCAAWVWGNGVENPTDGVSVAACAIVGPAKMATTRNTEVTTGATMRLTDMEVTSSWRDPEVARL